MDKREIIEKVGLTGDTDQDWLYLMSLSPEELEKIREERSICKHGPYGGCMPGCDGNNTRCEFFRSETKE